MLNMEEVDLHLFFLSEYSNIICMSLMFSLLFLGGKINSLLFPIQVSFLAFFFIWVRGTLPCYRYDKLMYLAWKCYLPVLLNMFIFLYMQNCYSLKIGCMS